MVHEATMERAAYRRTSSRVTPIRRLFNAACRLADVEPNILLESRAPHTLLALAEAGQGVAIIPSYGLPACRSRKLAMSRLINPVVPLDFSQIRLGGRKLPPVAEDFTSFLQSYIASWAGRSGIL